MNKKEQFLNSELALNYKVFKSNNRVLVLPFIQKFDTELYALNIYKNELTSTRFKITESNGEIIFNNLNTNQNCVFDISELNLGKVYFHYQNGLSETFEVKDLKPSSDLTQYLV